MGNLATVWDLERRCWTQGRSFYETVLAPDAVYAFPPPMGIFRGNDFVSQMGEDGPYSDVHFEDQQAIENGDTIIVVYKATGSGKGSSRTSICTSVYTHHADGWKLTTHHQTPIDG